MRSALVRQLESIWRVDVLHRIVNSINFVQKRILTHLSLHELNLHLCISAACAILELFFGGVLGQLWHLPHAILGEALNLLTCSEVSYCQTSQTIVMNAFL